jgi:hypothetical protein
MGYKRDTQMSKFKKTFAFLVLYSTASFIIFSTMMVNKVGSVGWSDLLVLSYLLVGAVIVVAAICVWAIGVLL